MEHQKGWSMDDEELTGSEAALTVENPTVESPSCPVEKEEQKRAFDDLNDRFLRLVADFENFKRRTARERESVVALANERFAVDMLEVVDNLDRALKSGMTANIFITTGVRKAVLALPASAIITSGADKFVFVDNGSSKSVKTPVTVGITAEDGRVEIVSGLKAGDKVVTYGNN